MLTINEIISQLKSLHENSQREIEVPGDIWDKDCEALDYAIQAVIEKQEREKSRFIELPCKVGDTVYLLREDTDCIEIGYVQQFVQYMNTTAANIRIESGRTSIISICKFGEILFLTYEEAEQALKENNNES